MSLKKNFGLRLKEIRKKKDITQFQLAEKAGIDAKHMSHIETGRSFPKADLIEKFANALEINYSELFCFKCEYPREKMISDINEQLKFAKDDKLNMIYRMLNDFLL